MTKTLQLLTVTARDRQNHCTTLAAFVSMLPLHLFSASP